MNDDMKKYHKMLEDFDLNILVKGEIALVVAVLERAIKDLIIPEERKQALWWFESNKFNVSPISFLWACEVLDIDPKAIRKRIREQSVSFVGKSNQHLRLV